MPRAQPSGWSSVVRIVAPRDARVAARVALAVDDPPAYVKRHAKELRQRGVTAPVARLPLIALLDGLQLARRVTLVDHRTSPDEVVELLRALRPKIPMRWSRGIDEDDERPVHQVLAQAAASAEDVDIALVNLDTDSDQYAVVAVRRSVASELGRACASLGVAVEVLRAEVPTTIRARSPRAPASRPLKPWPDASRDPPGTWRYFVHRENGRDHITVVHRTALDVHTGPLGGSSRREKRTFDSDAACKEAYLAELGALARAGWDQLSAAEHQRATLAAAAARKTRAPRS